MVESVTAQRIWPIFRRTLAIEVDNRLNDRLRADDGIRVGGGGRLNWGDTGRVSSFVDLHIGDL